MSFTTTGMMTLTSDYICKFELPLFLEMKKRIHINLNNYHTWHRFERNKVKQRYQNLLMHQMPKEVIQGRVSLVFVMHRGDKRKVDRANVLCLHEKFASDALVKAGVLEDDNDQFIESTHYYTGEIDKHNPRVDLFIRRVHEHQNCKVSSTHLCG